MNIRSDTFIKQNSCITAKGIQNTVFYLRNDFKTCTTVSGSIKAHRPECLHDELSCWTWAGYRHSQGRGPAPAVVAVFHHQWSVCVWSTLLVIQWKQVCVCVCGNRVCVRSRRRLGKVIEPPGFIISGSLCLEAQWRQSSRSGNTSDFTVMLRRDRHCSGTSVTTMYVWGVRIDPINSGADQDKRMDQEMCVCVSLTLRDRAVFHLCVIPIEHVFHWVQESCRLQLVMTWC